jgi:predicted Zn-dependent protease
MIEELARSFAEVAPAGVDWTLRFVDTRDEELSVRRGVVQPPTTRRNTGAMVTVRIDGVAGYGATSDLSRDGLARAAALALDWARSGVGRSVPAPAEPIETHGHYESTEAIPWASQSLGDKLDRLRAADQALGARGGIVDHEAGLWHTTLESGLASSAGGVITQCFRTLLPMLTATAARESESETRTFGGHAFARQAGLELLDDVGFDAAAGRVAEEACELLAAPNCPTGRMDLVLAPDQMILQIHESIGHPLELDRILGDERNYAGTSFVTPDMFGTYRYGSELLDVTFDPGVPSQLASYDFDDEGHSAKREHVIRNGVLLRGLGSGTSQTRTGLPGVSNSRAESGNRPPIDRMANLNLEPGTSTLEELVARVERGIFMETNCSWSIDDARNKFQFGCERGRVIEAGKLGGVVRKPNYRGISATFWRNLAGVGDASTWQVLGTPFCGKGEPNQVIRVGHAAPACLFRDVEVFGGA